MFVLRSVSVCSRAAFSASRSSAVLSSQATQVVTKRNLNIHEYQAQRLMRLHGINTPRGSVASTPDEAEKIAEALNTNDLVIKAQVLAGGRGKGFFSSGLKGGVHKCNSPQEVRDLATKMIGSTLFTKQTGERGKPVSTVFVCERHYLRREAYIAILLDRKSGGPAWVASPEGGVDIEGVARENPAAIHVDPIDIYQPVTDEQSQRVAHFMGFRDPQKVLVVQEQLKKMWEFFKQHDCTLLEVNPFAETAGGDILCMDAKLNFDDNASYRQKPIFELRDKSQEDPREVAASEYDLNYIGLDGSIGCLVNGAGLAMATMDIIKLYGGNPANFLDVGGGATQKQVTEAIKIISSDPNVKSILVNIFGGIMKCDIIALGLIAALKESNIKVPIVARLQGTNVDKAKKIMEDSGLRLIAADDLDDAAQKAVRVAEIVKLAEQADLDVSFKLPL